ncbi:hypothetical protein [Butyrivibrio fibrisolvens]|uniref:hypothetical protein n=1 Tax=Butyrivibrio fibrisolvens TaxID=831 RepID=UPI00041A69A6|nr:hypothetical protein [Butyrivibrio fibrisolvens]
MDKVTRMLMLYSKLIKGEAISKVSYCLENEINERTFDRDIQDIRLYLSETFSPDELLYERQNNSYYLTGVSKQPIEMTEYRFLTRLLIESELLRKDEVAGILLMLASNAVKPKDCVSLLELYIEKYENSVTVPLLKMHEDISLVIGTNTAIRILYLEKKHQKKADIVPYNISFSKGNMILWAVELKNEAFEVKKYSLNNINSFMKIKKLSIKESNKVKELLLKRKIK